MGVGREWCIISPGMAATLVGDACVEAESNNTKPEYHALGCGKDWQKKGIMF